MSGVNRGSVRGQQGVSQVSTGVSQVSTGVIRGSVRCQQGVSQVSTGGQQGPARKSARGPAMVHWHIFKRKKIKRIMGYVDIVYNNALKSEEKQSTHQKLNQLRFKSL